MQASVVRSVPFTQILQDLDSTLYCLRVIGTANKLKFCISDLKLVIWVING